MAKYLDNHRDKSNHVIVCPCCGSDQLYKYPYSKTKVDMLFSCRNCLMEFWVSISPVIVDKEKLNKYGFGVGGSTK